MRERTYTSRPGQPWKNNEIEYDQKMYYEIEQEWAKSFHERKTCERCNGFLEGGRTMSMFNTQCICIICSEVEKMHPDYDKACEEEKTQVNNRNRYFGGIGVDPKELEGLRKEYFIQQTMKEGE